MTEVDAVSYATTTTVLRPPRVAVLFRADERWRDWAKLALSAMSEAWGGLGFVLVPYVHDGSVEPSIVDALVAYDPDHIVAMSIHISDWERIWPAGLALQSESGERLEGDARTALVEQLTQQGWCHLDSAATVARQTLSKRCTPLRDGYPGTPDHEVTNAIRLGEVSSALVTMAGIKDFEFQPCLAVSPTWTSDGALLAAARAGVLPDSSTVRPEPAEKDILAWLINPASTAPPGGMGWYPKATGSDGRALSMWLRIFDPELAVFASSVARSFGVIVIGDSAADFALAVIYDRLFGYGLWLTTAMLDDAPLRDRTIRPALESMLSQLRGFPQKVQLTSASLDDEAITQAAAQLIDGPAYRDFVIEGPDVRSARAESMSIGRPSLREGRRLVAIREPLGAVATIPIKRDDDGTVTMLAPLTSTIPAAVLPLRDQLSVPYWLVDVTLSPDTMPAGRGLRSRWLQADDPAATFPARVRASRDGLTFAAQSQGFILAGSNLESRIVRPRLRQLGMRSWVQAMAEDQGLQGRLSNPGTQAQLVAQRLGGRDALLDLVSRGSLACLRRFAPVDPGRRSDQEFPDHNGVVLGSDPYPTRMALEQLAGGDRSAVGVLIDRLSAARLLRRGLVLDCAECQRPSFVSIDELSQAFQCQRCASTNELTSQRWRDGTHDPHWYYDLHPSFRELVGTGGDTVLLAGAYLKEQARSYRDVAEMEFIEDGSPVAEVDLIALTDQQLVLVEAKASGSFGSAAERRRETTKKLRIAEVLRADLIVLATPQARWTKADVTEFQDRIRHMPHGGPEILTLTGLGAGTGQLA